VSRTLSSYARQFLDANVMDRSHGRGSIAHEGKLTSAWEYRPCVVSDYNKFVLMTGLVLLPHDEMMFP